MEAILPILIAGAGSVVGSLVTAWLLRRSSKESNDTTAFKVVTDQLLALNSTFRTELDVVKKELAEVKTKVALQEKELDAARKGQDAARKVSASLAAYIKKLLSAWPVGNTPPGPDDVLDWQQHL